MIVILILYLLFASTFTIDKAVLAYVPPLFFTSIRMLGSGILLLSYYLIRYGKIRISRRDIFLFLGLIIFHSYIPYVFEFSALRYLNSSKVALLYNLAPFITALFAYILGTEKFDYLKVIAIIIGLIGFVPVLIDHAPWETATGSIAWFSRAELLQIMSVCCACLGWIIMSILVSKKYSPTALNGLSLLSGGILASITCLTVEGWPPVITYPAPSQAPALFSWFLGSDNRSIIAILVVYTLYIILVADVICYNMYSWLLKQYSATFLSFFSDLISPLCAAFLGFFFLSEEISASFFISVGITCSALLLFYYAEKRRSRMQLTPQP